MTLQREKQNISASQLLQSLSDGEDIQLSQCLITGVLDINRLFDEQEKFATEKLVVRQEKDIKQVLLGQSIVFDKCTFEENVVFSAPWSEPDSLSVNFERNVIFNSSVFNAQSRFRNAVFEGIASFDGCTFNGVTTFKNAVIKKEAKFRTVAFNGYFLCGDCVFESAARFTNTHFAKGANFAADKFLGPTDFSGVYSSSRAVPACERIHFARHKYGEDESFWRFAKQSAQEAGYYQLAGQYFYNERCSRLWGKLRGTIPYDSLSIARKMVRWVFGLRLLPELIFGRFLFGYGERPTRVLTASALIIVVCAFFYYSQPGLLIYRDQGPVADASFLQGLYFSMITFTTLGYGDLYPAPEPLCRVVAMSEAVIGGFLMALFVVCLAKRFSRG